MKLLTTYASRLTIFVLLLNIHYSVLSIRTQEPNEKITPEEMLIIEEIEEEETIVVPPKVLELNTATIDELLTIPGITPPIATSIINYAIEVGFKKVDDLKRISGITAELYERIKRYFVVKAPEPVKPVTTKLTLRFMSRTPPLDYYHQNKKFQNPYYLYKKADFFLPNRISFGWIVRQGGDRPTLEPPHSIDWSIENIIKYNLTSWWIDVNNFAGVDKLIVGSYILDFGQGLIFYKKPTDTHKFLFTESKVKPKGIQVYKTSLKNAGLNGFAIQKSIKNFTFYGFYSNKRLSVTQFNPDGSIANALEGWEAGFGNPVRNLDGAIQSEQDIHNFGRLESILYGFRVSASINNTLLGFTGFVNTYRPNINPPASYGYHLFRGDRNLVYGFDFDTEIDRINIFGEFAKSENKNQDTSQYKGIAGIVGFMADFEPFRFINKYFYYAPNYHNEYSGAHTFDYAPDMNQQGAFFEAEYRYSSGKIKANYTIANYPWINQRFKIFTRPHGGSSLHFEINQTLTDKISLHFRQINTYKEDKTYMYKSPVYGSIYKNMPENKCKTCIQLTFKLRRNVNLRFRYDRIILNTHRYDFKRDIFHNTLEIGNLVFGEFSVPITDNLILAGRATIFNDTGPNGVYISQSEPYWLHDWRLWSPRFDYQLKEAARYYLTLKHKLAKGSWLWIKYINLFNYEYQRMGIPSDTEQLIKTIRTNPQEIRLEYEVQF